MNAEGPQFCDTNVLVYAHDVSAGSKRDLARDLVDRLCSEDRLRISPQVLSELYVTVTRKLVKPLPPEAAAALVGGFSPWSRCATTAETVVAAVSVAGRYRLSLWDALVVVSAQESGAAVLWSEDLQDGARYGAVEVRNPFAPSSAG